LPKAARATWAEHAVPELSKAGFAYDILRRRILDNTYRPGDRLRLSELAHDLNLSEMPVREALRLLQKDGLVIMRLHRGAEVARLSFQRGLDVIEARMTLERAVARGHATSQCRVARWTGTAADRYGAHGQPSGEIRSQKP